MAGPVRERVTAADRRHFDFVQTLLRISDELTEEETANVKLFCLHLIPKGQAAQLRRAVDVFQKLMELDKIDQENLDFLKEILERIGRQDLIQNVLRSFQPPDREIPENPELQPGSSQQGADAEGNASSNTYVVVNGQVRMIQETLDRLRNHIARLSGTRRSQVKFRGYKKHKSILVHFSIPRENTAVLRHMADHSDPRLVYMGVKLLQIDAEVPIKVQQGAPVYDVKRQLPVDDIEVGCSTRTKHQRAPQSWTRLSALNLFSDALPLHLQAAASLEYQGFSYSLVRALVQKDRLREHQMRQAIQNLRNAEVDSNTLRQKAEVDSNTLRQKAEVDSNTLRQKAEVDSNTLRQKAEVDSNTIMTLRSKLNITENRLKEALETITVLEENLKQAQEYAEKVAKQVTSHVTEYRGEKPPGGWQQEYRREKPPGGWPQEMAGPVRERVTDADRRHFDFVKTLLRISDELTEEETANVKLFCLHLIPKGQMAQLRRAVDVFVKLMELDKIDHENLDFLKEILEGIGRQDLIQNVLQRFQPPDREIPENPDLQPENPDLQPGNPELHPGNPDLQLENPDLQPENPDQQPDNPDLQPENPDLQPQNPELQSGDLDIQPGQSNAEGANEEGNATSNTYVVVHGQVRMIQEALDRLKGDLARLSGTRRSQVMYRGHKKHKSILVHFSIPRKNTAVLRHMADHSDPRLVYMGVKSLQIDAEVPIKVQQEAPVYDVKRQLPVDDVEVGCSTRTRHQRAPQGWTRLSALNLFSDALPLHLQAAASLEYQGFSYSLVRALVQKDRLREHQMRQAIQNLRNAELDSNTLRQKAEVDSNTLRQKAEVDSNTLRQKAEVDSNTLRQTAEVDSNTLRQNAEVDSNTLRQNAEVDSNTIMTLRSKFNISENRLKEALDTIEVLQEKLQQAQEYAEKAAKQVTSHVTEYRGEKPPGGWPQEYRGEKPPGGWPQEYRGEKPPGGWPQEYRGEKPPGGWPQEYRGEKPPGGWPQEYRGEKPPGETLHEYRGEKPPGGWSAQVEKSDTATQKHLAGPVYTTGGLGDVGDKLGGDLAVQEEDKRSARQDSGIGREDVLGSEAPMQERHTAGMEGTASRPPGDMKQITFGGKGSEPGKFDFPRGVVVSPSNDIFVADYNNRRVQVHSTEGVYLRHFPTVVPGTEDKVMKPHDVCMDGNGTLWVVGRGWTADHVVQYSTDGTAMAGIDLEKIDYFRGITVDMRTNHILITDADQDEVQIFRPDGSLVRTVRHPRGGEMTDPRYVTVDGEGNILVSDWDTHYVYVYDESGKFLFQFGGEGSGEVQLDCPRGICTDSSGHIIVADFWNERVQIFTRHGEFVRTVRTGFGPIGLAVGPEGQLVVTNDQHCDCLSQLLVLQHFGKGFDSKQSLQNSYFCVLCDIRNGGIATDF
uniref:DED domain-containing protein n=1 Tax=Branchiostoma floridae TaxID=7739 RepID=C3ZU33_BRAFL|eukprot:XP_002587908.1 hypothetical protein BRAFLDRAFT_87296 [Branchiostoma floridae]